MGTFKSDNFNNPLNYPPESTNKIYPISLHTNNRSPDHQCVK